MNDWISCVIKIHIVSKLALKFKQQTQIHSFKWELLFCFKPYTFSFSRTFFIKLHLSGTLWIKIPMCRLKYYSIDFCVRVAAVDQYENPDSWVLFQKSLCELMCVSKISSFHLDKKCAAIYYLLRWPLPPNDPKCVTQYFETLIRIGPGSWRWLIYGALSKKCPYNSCWLLGSPWNIY